MMRNGALTMRLTGASLALLGGLSATLAQAENGDAIRGRQLFESRCVGCHSLDQNRVGPALGTVFGRSAGRQPDFAYSPALQRATHVWTTDKLQTWLADPEAMVPGQAMGYSLAQAQDRRDVVAFLSSLAKAPVAR